MGGSGGSGDLVSQEVLSSLNQMMATYLQLENMAKVKQETQTKIGVLFSKLQDGSVSIPVVNTLKAICQAAE
jgi:hypothetical protein